MLGLKLINDLPVVLVVPNEHNKNPRNGNILIARHTTMHLDRAVTMLAAKDRQALIAQQGSRTSVKLLCLSKQSYETLCQVVRRARISSTTTTLYIPSSSGSRSRPLLTGASDSGGSSDSNAGALGACIGLLCICGVLAMLIVGIVMWTQCSEDADCQTGIALTCVGGGLLLCCCCRAVYERGKNDG